MDYQPTDLQTLTLGAPVQRKLTPTIPTGMSVQPGATLRATTLQNSGSPAGITQVGLAQNPVLRMAPANLQETGPSISTAGPQLMQSSAAGPMLSAANTATAAPTTHTNALVDDSVAPRVEALLARDNPLIQQARSQGLAASNRRGLLNSSMAVGASQGAAYATALPIAQQEAQQAYGKNMSELDRRAQMERLTADAGFTSERQKSDLAAQMERLNRQGEITGSQQSADIAAQMARLREQAGFDKDRLGMELGSRSALQQAQDAAEMERLRANGNISLQLQSADQNSQMNRLEVQGAQQMRLSEQQSKAEEERLTASLNSEMDRLHTSLSGADLQQRQDIAAQMQRLQVSGQQELQRIEKAATLDKDRIQLQGTIDTALQSSGAQQQQALAKVQGDIQSALQGQQDTAQLQRMGAQFAQDLAVQQNENAAALQRIGATGDQQLKDTALRLSAALQETQMTIAAGDRQAIASAMTGVFQAEAQMRGGVLSNPNIPAAERAAYEQSIARMGDPLRSYINGLFSSGGGRGYDTANSFASVADPMLQVVSQRPGGLAAGLPSLS